MTTKTTTAPTASTEHAPVPAVTPEVDANRFAPLVRLQRTIAATWAGYMAAIILVLTSSSPAPGSATLDSRVFAQILFTSFLIVAPFLIASSAFTSHAATANSIRSARAAGVLLSIPGTAIGALTVLLSVWLINLLLAGPMGVFTASALALSTIFTIRFWTLYRAATRPARMAATAAEE